MLRISINLCLLALSDFSNYILFRLFADCGSLFSVKWTKYLKKIKYWAVQRKTSLNPDPPKTS